MFSARKEQGIARKLGSADESECLSAMAELARLYPAPAAAIELAIWAIRSPDICRSYTGKVPLAQHFLEALPLPEDPALAWGIALFEGDQLMGKFRLLEERHGAYLRRVLRKCCRNPEDVWHDVVLRWINEPKFRRVVFGKYAGRGTLRSFLMPMLVREAVRTSKFDREQSLEDTRSEHARQGKETGPSVAAERKEMRQKIVNMFAVLAEDIGFVPFILKQYAGLSMQDVLQVLREPKLTAGALRKRVHDFKNRFRREWSDAYPEDICPFADDEKEEGSGEVSP